MSRAAFDPCLYLVTDAAACGARGVPETVRAAVAGGVTAVQLRDHRATARELTASAIELRDLLAGTGVSLVVDDRLDVALAVGADGVHLGQSDLPVGMAREIAGARLVIGWSVTCLSDAAAAAALAPGTVDYLGVGPVFTTATKPDAAAPIGLDGLRAICAASRVPCVAIGGITVERAREVTGAGVAGIAVAAAICAAREPTAAAAELRRRIGR
ncbi:MAG: thiamine phosphate synthase [Acidimicrobiales bacterium]